MNYEKTLKDIELQSEGFPPSNVVLTQKVYADLVIAKKWKRVEYKPCPELEICIIYAHEPDNEDRLVILPIYQSDFNLSVQRINEIFHIISQDTQSLKITLGIYSSDSTIVYYHIGKGLVKPTQRNN